MVTDEGSAQAAPWPMPKFIFQVNLGPGLENTSFQEVSGLNVEDDVIEFRSGNSPTFSTIKMPGIKKFKNVTLKKGVFANNKAFDDWHAQAYANVKMRGTVTINLLDDSGAVTMRWQLKNARPIKVTTDDFKSTGNEVAIESIELTHEGLTISTGK